MSKREEPRSSQNTSLHKATASHLMDMKSNVFTVIVLCVFVFFVFFEAGVHAEEESTIIRVALLDNRPLSFQGDDGKAKGVYPEVIREIAKRENWILEFVLDSWKGSLESLKAGRIDLMIAIVRSPEREELFDFSHEPVLTAWGQVYTKPGSDINSIIDLEGKKVAVMERGINGQNFVKLTETFGVNCTVVPVKSFEDVCKAILAGDVDAGVMLNVSGGYLMRRFPVRASPIVFSPGNGHFAVQKGKHSGILHVIDEYLFQWKADKNSVYYQILNRAYGIDPYRGLMPYLILSIFGIGLSISVLFFLWVTLLRKQVRKRTAELRGEKVFIESALDSLSDTFLVFDLESGRAIRWNEAFRSITGYMDEEIAGMKNLDDFHEIKDLEAIRRAIAELETKKYASLEMNLITKYGGMVPIEFYFSQFFDDMTGTFKVIQVGRDISDRKQVEEALRESKERISDIIEFSPDAMLAIDREKRVIIWNKAIEKMTGIPASEIVGKGDYAYTVPFYGERRPQLMDVILGDSEEVTALYPPIVRQGDTFTVEVFCSALYNNAGAWVFVKASPLHDAAGNIIGAIESIRDITFSKRVEEALRESEEQFRVINESALDAVLLMDDEGRAVYVNPAAEKMFGFTQAELIGRDIHSFLVPERYIETFRKGFREFKRTGTGPAVGKVLELSAKRKDGQEIPVEIAVTPVLRGGHYWASAAVRDITDRKEAEEALRESEEKYRTILESIEDGYYEVDLAGNLTFFNHSACRILGYPRNELIGMSNKQFMSRENARGVFKTFNHVYVSGKADRAFDWEIITKEGETRFLEASISLMRDKEGKPTGFQGICRDITDRKRAEDEREKLRSQLMQAQKLESVGQLAGGVAHDFNNLLTTILGNAELILMDIPKDDPLREEVEEIKASGERAASLTRQLLAFSRKQILQPEVMNFNDTIQDMQKMLRRMIREDIELRAILAPDLGRVEADVGQIEQIIMNLVVNAGDAMPEGGTVIIETENIYLDDEYAKDHIDVTPGPYVMMSVSDTGIGMTEEVRTQIFEPFFTTKEKGKGTGLGLSTVYGIVKQSNGTIWVYSQPGKGTTFKVYLPRVDQLISRTEPVEKGVNDFTGTETVLIVEDDEQVRKFTVRSLEGYGYTVLSAANGEEGIGVASRHVETIHLILTDVIMPGMSGREMAERLKSSRPDVKVVYMSGYTDNAIVHHGILNPGVAFISKPFTLEDLGRKIREVLEA